MHGIGSAEMNGPFTFGQEMMQDEGCTCEAIAFHEARLENLGMDLHVFVNCIL